MAEVTHQSGVSRLCNSLFCALCGFPIMFLAGIIVLGYNEQRAVCDAKAIDDGLDEVLEVDCMSATNGDGKLVMFSCNLNQEVLTAGALAPPGDFQNLLSSYVGTGLRVVAEMYQCVEAVHSETTKDSVGGGKATSKTYTYSKEWRSSPIDSNSFHQLSGASFTSNCGAFNPAWPANVPRTGTSYSQQVKAGAFTLQGSYVSKIPLNTTIPISGSPPGWEVSGSQSTTSKYAAAGSDIGKMRVSFYGTDWFNPLITAMGENSGSVLKPWTAPNSWLCSGFTLQDLRTGRVSKEELFEALASVASALTWVLRLLGFALAWIAFSLLAGPLEVAGDCIPCIGPYLGDAVASTTCCVSCLPATACSLLVIGVVWVAMRPVLGILLIFGMLMVLCSLAAGKLFHMWARPAEGRDLSGVTVGMPSRVSADRDTEGFLPSLGKRV